LFEGLLILLRTRPWALPRLLLAAGAGRAQLKARLAEAAPIDASSLPYESGLIAHLTAQRAAGRRLILATAAPAAYARAVSDHVGLFDEVFASDERTNLKGQTKARRLVEAFGERGFAYAGDSPSDLPIWRVASEAILVGPGGKLRSRLPEMPSRVIGSPGGRWRSLLRAARPHQWAKNVLLFLPLLLAHRYDDAHLAIRALLAFAAFSLCASSVYLLNDLIDIDADRRHPTKRRRPLAVGDLSIPVAVAATPVLAAIAFAGAAALSASFALYLGIYLALTLIYSLGAKRIAVLDVALLAALYALRIAAGGVVLDVAISPWLIAFAIFLFLGLAFAKRVADLVLLEGRPMHGRSYSAADLPILSQMGVASSYVAALVLALYVHSDDVRRLYSKPDLLWGVCGLYLVWQTRVWLATHRGEVKSDPVVFALRDPLSYVCAAIVAAIAFFAT
jgi:4-hydroxybenzoate polyprenyltransferase/phosphoserine phosphatase